jgi:hypothetical protein
VGDEGAVAGGVRKQGRDDRPVQPTVAASTPALSIDFDPPTGFHDDVLQAILSAVRPALAALANRLEGCRRLHLELHFACESSLRETRTRAIDCTFVEPVCDESRFRATVSHQLQILNWPAELSGLSLSLLEFGELMPRQLTLFEVDESSPAETRSPLAQIAERLAGRYGQIFFHPRLADQGHPLPERRVALQTLSTGYAL